MRRFIEAELKRANLTYSELAKRLNEHGLEGETEASVNSKLVRGTFPATFLMACLAVFGDFPARAGGAITQLLEMKIVAGFGGCPGGRRPSY